VKSPRSSPAAPYVAKHTYTSPYGKVLAQVQKTGSWVAVSQLSQFGDKREVTATLLKNLAASWHELAGSALPQLASLDDRQLRCIWSLPSWPGLVPLSSLCMPLASHVVQELILRLAASLEQLHQLGLAAYDLAPSVIFFAPPSNRVTLLPTLWLASQARWFPGRIKDMPYVAPELAQSTGQSPLDPTRADVYALGKLAGYLLTGEEHNVGRDALPSEQTPVLAQWDPFLDGCRRSNPARRFDSIPAAIATLTAGCDARRIPSDGEETGLPASASQFNHIGLDSDETGTSVPPPRTGRQRRSRQLVLGIAFFILAALGFSIYLRRDSLAAMFPSIGGVMVPYQRGFGDTIIAYADRAYDGASWKKLRESDSFATMTTLRDRRGSEIKLRGVVGWDDDSFWVMGCTDIWTVLVFRCRNGHWSLQGELETNSVNKTLQRLLDQETLLVATGDYLYEMSPRGTISRINNKSANAPYGEICPIAADLFYHLAGGWKVFKFAGSECTEMDRDKYKEVSVHRADNTPLPKYDASAIKHTRAMATGKAIGVVGEHPPKVVAFRDGIWYDVTDLPERQVNDVWVYAERASAQCLVTVGQEGNVHTHSFNGQGRDLSVSTPQEATHPKLIKAWGTNPDKFWVMDRCGTVWERKGTGWRVVVRGLYRDDVAFEDAWVSPRGTVIAITKKHVYRLE
jgi:hypothetical protein